MPSWLKQATYLASVLCGVVAAAQPQYAIFLVPASTFLAGYATTHPNDVAPKPSPESVANLSIQLQKQLEDMKKAQ